MSNSEEKDIPGAPTELVLQPREKNVQPEPSEEKGSSGPLNELRVFPEWTDAFCDSLPKLEKPHEQPLPKLCRTLSKVTKGWRRIGDLYADVQKTEIEAKKKKREEEPDDDDEPIDETIHEPVLVAPRKADEQREDLAAGTENFWATYLTSQINFIGHAVSHLKDRLPEGESYLWRNIFPSAEEGMPKYNPNGRYVVKLFVQSKWRAVVVDDRVPVDANGNAVFPHSLGWLDTGECWPLILAKALCQVNPWEHSHGGCNFLHHLCGWLTQEVLIPRGEEEPKSEDAKSLSHWDKSLSMEKCLGAYMYEEPPFDAPSVNPDVKTAETSEVVESPKSDKKKRVHIPHPRCYLVRPGKEGGEEEEEEKNPIEDLEYANLCPRLKRRRIRLALDGKTKLEDPPQTLVVKKTKASGGSWKRFPSYNIVFVREMFPFKREIVDTWTDLKQSFSTQPHHLLFAEELSEETTVHLTFDPLESTKGAVTGNKELTGTIKVVEDEQGIDEKHSQDSTAETSEKTAKEKAEAKAEENRANDEMQHSYLVAIYEYDWHSHNRFLVVEKICTGFSYLCVTLTPGRRYSVHVKNECGCYIAASSNRKFHFTEWKEGIGYAWSSAKEPNVESKAVNPQYNARVYKEEGSYGSHKAGEWITLFNIQIKVPETPTPTPYSNPGEEESTGQPAADLARISACLHIMDSSLNPHILLQWVNNDTMETTQNLLLDAAPRPVPHNESGYSLTASIKLPKDVIPGKWRINFISSVPLEEFNLSPMKEISSFSGSYTPNVNLILFREVISCDSAQPVSVNVSSSDAKLGIHVRLIDAGDINVVKGLPEESKEICSLSRIEDCLFPSVNVGGDKKLLLECKLDPIKCIPACEKDGEIKWKVVISSENEVQMSTDCTKTTYFNAIKEYWGAEDSERKTKAGESRKKHLEAKDNSKRRAAKRIVKKEEENVILVDEKFRKEKKEECQKKEETAKKHFEAFKMWKEHEGKDQAQHYEEKRKESKSWTEESVAEENKYIETVSKLVEEASTLLEAKNSLKGLIEAGEGDGEGEEKGGAQAIEEQIDVVEKLNASRWRVDHFLKCAKTRVEEINIAKAKDFLSVPLEERKFDEILEFVKTIEAKPDWVVTYSVRKWLEHSINTTVKHILKKIEEGLGDAEAEEPEVNTEVLQQMLALLANVEKVRPLEKLGLSKEDNDILLDAKDAMANTENDS